MEQQPLSLIGEMQDLSALATKVLREYLSSSEGNRAERDRGKIALGTINTAVSLIRASWNQQRHHTNIARTLADGDLDVFAGYVRQAMPEFPEVRKAAIPEPKI